MPMTISVKHLRHIGFDSIEAAYDTMHGHGGRYYLKPDGSCTWHSMHVTLSNVLTYEPGDGRVLYENDLNGERGSITEWKEAR